MACDERKPDERSGYLIVQTAREARCCCTSSMMPYNYSGAVAPFFLSAVLLLSWSFNAWEKHFLPHFSPHSCSCLMIHFSKRPPYQGWVYLLPNTSSKVLVRLLFPPPKRDYFRTREDVCTDWKIKFDMKHLVIFDVRMFEKSRLYIHLG